ncbi:hypothetical protein GIB67_014758 [Kingdonia uniflora]|uniref:Cytochrome c-552/DMSO reductase-like haem-binding domain-containing protein n=1 Tax=Kingdonia uniflora TaxID=39325 RepID=A0A7J7NUS1_9MAGN|nr:hypothetical protein GIB67_014758 [Kingdonia uniflora]
MFYFIKTETFTQFLSIIMTSSSSPTMLSRFSPLLGIAIVIITSDLVISHEESGEWSCSNSNSDNRIQANFVPGVVTLDGHANDWDKIDGHEFSLLPALDPHEDDAYKGGTMTLKALHDGKDMYFLLEVDGEYVYNKGDSHKCPSVALMFQIGENASYHRMGGCEKAPDACSSKACRGHEVDIMHFSIGNAIPGRLYGGNPIDNRDGNGGDRFGHLVDVYSWNPHCRYLDGLGPAGNDSIAQNDWKGAWWHDSLNVHSDPWTVTVTGVMCVVGPKENTCGAALVVSEAGVVRGFVEEDSPYASADQKGKYYFEFSRPLRTMDRLQQDVQFAIGQSSKMAVAFWYPIGGKPWHGSAHYSINCDWVPLDITSLGTSAFTKTSSRSSWDAASAFSLLLSVLAFCLSAFIGYAVSRNKSIHFTPMDRL